MRRAKSGGGRRLPAAPPSGHAAAAHTEPGGPFPRGRRPTRPLGGISPPLRDMRPGAPIPLLADAAAGAANDLC